MRVLLIQPPTPKKSIGLDEFFRDEPLALEYLAADVKAIAEVEILDMRLDRNLSRELAKFNPDVIGITGFITHVNMIHDICYQVKQLQPNALTVVGGHHATVAPQDFLHPSIDLIVIGDGVPAFKEIVQSRAEGKEYRGLPGVAFAQSGLLCKTEPRSITDLDDFPLPERSLTKRYRKKYHNEFMQREALVRTSRGCTHHCKFCVQWKLTQRKYLVRSIDSIVEELRQIEEDCVCFIDDEAFLNVKRMRELATAITAAGIKKRYMAATRADTIIHNPEVFEQWRKIGLDGLYVGLEFYFQEDLDYIDKGTSPEVNREAVNILKKLDIHTYPLFIIRPDYDLHTLKSFAEYVKQFGFDRMVQFSVLTPLPGSDLYDDLREQLLDVDFEYFDCLHSVIATKLSPKDFYAELVKLYRRSTPMKNYPSYLLKLPWTAIPARLWKDYRFLARIRALYKDYPADGDKS